MAFISYACCYSKEALIARFTISVHDSRDDFSYMWANIKTEHVERSRSCQYFHAVWNLALWLRYLRSFIATLRNPNSADLKQFGAIYQVCISIKRLGNSYQILINISRQPRSHVCLKWKIFQNQTCILKVWLLTSFKVWNTSFTTYICTSDQMQNLLSVWQSQSRILANINTIWSYGSKNNGKLHLHHV